MSLITAAFVALLALGTALEMWLAGRQITAVRAHRERVPEPFADAERRSDCAASPRTRPSVAWPSA